MALKTFYVHRTQVCAASFTLVECVIAIRVWQTHEQVSTRSLSQANDFRVQFVEMKNYLRILNNRNNNKMNMHCAEAQFRAETKMIIGGRKGV